MMGSHYRGVDPQRLSGPAREVYDTWARLHREMGLSEAAANREATDAVIDAGLVDDGSFAAGCSPARRQGLSEAAANILEAGAPPRFPLLDDERPPVGPVGRTDGDWSMLREAARRCGAQPPAWNESGMSDDERRFNDLVAARERRGMSFREAIAEAEAAIHRVTHEKDSR